MEQNSEKLKRRIRGTKFKEELIEMVTQLTKKVIDSKGKVISFQEEKPTKSKTKKKKDDNPN